MNDTHRDVRFYATVCTAELRPRNAIYALVERLFDADYGVRAVAIEALAGYPVRELDLAMVRCRHALHSDDPERVAAAASAISELADINAMNDLIDTVGRDGKRGESVRRALIALTKQDLGTSERKWRKWWEEHRKKHRIEWLIEGLGHKDAAIRQSAAEDLRKLTGEYFGFHHDLPKRERETSQARWTQWWNETGRRRFVRDDDERHRPTAVVKVIEKKSEPPAKS
jgi:HEAT repeat protein